LTYPRRNIKTSKGGKEKRKRERKVTREKKTKRGRENDVYMIGLSANE